MKKLLLTLISLGLGKLAVMAQQDPQYTQFFLNKLAYNPAYAGTEEKICGTLFYRSQWLGFAGGEAGGVPTTFGLNVHSNIGSKFGLGLHIANDEQGFERNLNVMLNASYRYTFQNSSVLSFGLAGGFMQKNLAGDKLKFRDGGDPLIPNAAVTGIGLDLNAGLYYMMPNLWRFQNVYAGLSATHLTQSNIKYEWSGNVTDNPLKLHYYFVTGASYELTPALALEPNILVKTDVAKTTIDVNAMVMFNNKIRGGLTYRSSDAVSILVGYKFLPELMVGYSYDFTTSNIITYSSGSHEIVLRYCLTPKFTPKETPTVPRLTPRFL
jgi:type IX secretion system PorP/SprF family membrane protein